MVLVDFGNETANLCIFQAPHQNIIGWKDIRSKRFHRRAPRKKKIINEEETYYYRHLFDPKSHQSLHPLNYSFFMYGLRAE